MRRKVARIGACTLMVSLPSKWVKANHIQKGDELTIDEKGHKLIIGGRGSKKEKISLNVKNIPNILYRVIGALYKAGYDEIELFYDTPTELSIIQQQLGRTCIGFELVEQTKNRVVIKTISKSEVDEFNVVLRRCFLSLIAMSENSLEAIKNKDKELLEKVILSDDSINRYSDFCRRIINKEHDVGGRRAPIYFITEQLEKVGDMYRDLSKYMVKKPFKLNKSILEVYEEINCFVNDFYEIYYSFDLKRMDSFILKKKEIKVKLEKCFAKANNKEIKVLFYLNNVFSTTFDMNGALLTAKI